MRAQRQPLRRLYTQGKKRAVSINDFFFFKFLQSTQSPHRRYDVLVRPLYAAPPSLKKAIFLQKKVFQMISFCFPKNRYYRSLRRRFDLLALPLYA